MIFFSSKRKLNKINKFLKFRIKTFLQRKVPFSESYPYKVHDPYLVLGDKSGYEKLYLVGDKWLDKSTKLPISVMIGFNDWKFGFVSDYVSNYRTAYSSRKFQFWKAYFMFRKFKKKPSAFIVWGYTESFYIRYYAKRHFIPIYRMEDGFIRSSLLGASHATPYSLIMDQGELYYNPSKASDLEQILNTYKFKKNPTIIDDAKSSLELIQKYKTSKYNQPILEKTDKLGLKLKKRIVILGQVDNDAAMRYGNTDKWTFEEVIKLARYENPKADIYYRPHPEVYHGYQKSKFKKRKIDLLCKIVSPNEPLLEFLESIDHVYVINSLSGLEALIRGIKVTVMGAAFYAGWGLTDDRISIKRRKRKLTIEELVAGIYLLYPKYLSSLDDSALGLKTAIYRIHMDKFYAKYQLCKSGTYNEKHITDISHTEFWPQVFMQNTYKLSEKEEIDIIQNIKFNQVLYTHKGDLFEIVLLYFIVGALKHDKAKDKFITKVREYVSLENLNAFLIDLLEYYPSSYIYKHIKWVLVENDEHTISTDVLERYLATITYEEDDDNDNESETSKEITVSYNLNIETPWNKMPSEAKKETKKTIFNKEDSTLLFELLDTHIENNDYNNAIEVAKQLLLFNNPNTILFVRLAELAKNKSDLASSSSIANFLQHINITKHNQAGIHLELESFNFERSQESLEYIIKLFILQLKFTPDRINRSWAILKRYFISDDYYQLFKSSLNLYTINDLHRAVALMEINEVNKALQVVESLIEDGENSDKLYVVYSQILFALGNIDKALEVITTAISREGTHANYTEYLRLLKAKGDFTTAFKVAKEGLDKKIPLTNDGHIMPIYFGLGKIEDGFKAFWDYAVKDKLRKSFPQGKYRETHHFDNFDNVLLIFSSGPAEEMRFSSLYNEIDAAIGHNNYKITCDYRLHAMLSRSFPKIHFIPVRRTRFFTPEYPVDDYNKLPNSELCIAIDNHTIEYIEEAKEIKLITDLFFHFRKTYDDFNGLPHLVTDSERVRYFKEKLPKDKILIGLSWRSLLTNAMRNIHYLSVEDLAPLFKLKNVVFVNLQYDECQHELDIIKDKYNGNIIDFPELDQMNDFDGVAGLMKSLDLVISPFTAVIELAGSIGVNSILFSNHGEVKWRKKNGKDIDVWYNSVKIIDNGQCGNKKALVDGILDEIQNNYIKKGKKNV